MGGNYFQEHKVRLYLDKELYVAFIRLQADKCLGRSYAGLLPFIEGLYHMGYINREIYQQHLLRYSEKLVGKKQLTLAETQEMEKNIQLAKLFEAIAKQWLNLTPQQQKLHLQRALANRQKVPQAELIIKLSQSANKREG
jgi:hypothetical protein